MLPADVAALVSSPGAGRVLRAPSALRAATVESLSGSSGGLTTPEAAPLFTAAWRRRYGRPPTLPQLDSLLCVSRFDGGYGSWPVDSAMFGSKNLGAIECHRNGADCSEANPGDSCAPLSTWEMKDGQKIEMVECFRTYPTWDAAADDFLANMTAPIRPRTGAALAAGALRPLTAAMHLERYFSADPDAYALALWHQAGPIGQALGRAPAVYLDAPTTNGHGGAPAVVALGVFAAGALWWATRTRGSR